MVMKVEPVFSAVESVLGTPPSSPVIMLMPFSKPAFALGGGGSEGGQPQAKKPAPKPAKAVEAAPSKPTRM